MVLEAPCPDWVANDPVATRYRALFATIDWSVLTPAATAPRRPGPIGTPPALRVRVLLVKISEQLPSIPRLRQFLLEHPALVWEIGLHRSPAAPAPDAEDAEAWLVQERQLRRWQQQAAPWVTQLVTESARQALVQVPDLDAVTALDATHHLAWVKHNNQNQTVTPRFDATQPPRGDPDCRLGAKVRHPSPFLATKVAFWGYHSAVCTSTTAGAVVVLGATVASVVAQEVELAPPVQAQVETVLGRPPRGLTADAAFDSVALWDWTVAAGGTAAIALNPRNGVTRHTPQGVPICAQGHPMRPVRHRDPTPPWQHYTCPVKADPHASCPHPRFLTGGCHAKRATSPGGLARRTVDRASVAYQTAYRQRTCVERVFSQLKSWGLERPIARSLATMRTIILTGYLLINLRALVKLARE